MLRSFVLIALVAITSGAPEVHEVRTMYPQGQLRSVRSYIGTRETGMHRGWWPNGQRQFELRYRDGVMEGESREWHANGRLFRVSRYVRGHEAGLQQMFDTDGTLRASYEIRGGRRYGSIGAMGCTPGKTLAVAP